MYNYRVLISFKGTDYSILIKSDFPIAQRGEFHPLVATHMKQNKGIDVTSGFEIISVENV